MRVLLVEDDAGVAGFVLKGFRAEGYPTIVARDCDEALRVLKGLAARGDWVDVVVLDLGLPGRDGTELLGELRRRWRDLPVIVLTARREVSQKVSALEAGAADYLTKPFAFAELLVRMRKALRGAEGEAASELVVGDLRLDLLAKVARRGQHQAVLTPPEWAMLELFMRSPRQVFTKGQILSHVWGDDYGRDGNVVEVYVSRLRRKLPSEQGTAVIETVRGFGYRLGPS